VPDARLASTEDGDMNGAGPPVWSSEIVRDHGALEDMKAEWMRLSARAPRAC
jgi:hypothetical protein